MYGSLLMIHYWDVPAAFGIGDRPLSADMMQECLKYSDVDAVILPPAILEDMSQSEEATNLLQKMAYVGFGGGKHAPVKHSGKRDWQALIRLLAGNLASEVGDRLVNNGVTLLNVISATE